MSPTHVAASPRQAAEQVQAGQAVLTDVREPLEFARSHVPYAISIPLNRLAEALPLLAITPEKTIIFQCQNGTQSVQACQIARSLYPDQNIYHLKGGLKAWETNGLPMFTNSGPLPPSWIPQSYYNWVEFKMIFGCAGFIVVALALFVAVLFKP